MIKSGSDQNTKGKLQNPKRGNPIFCFVPQQFRQQEEDLIYD